VVLEYQVAPADAPYKATFKIGHGCGESPTRQVSVAIPAGVTGAKPMPKPGWALEVQRTGPNVARVTWTARSADAMLPNDQYDEFVVVARTPKEPGTIYWPVNQVCENGRTDWVEVPRDGRKPSDLKSPAAALEILPAAGGGGHKH
jgi:periplasmic copper chaperone A